MEEKDYIGIIEEKNRTIRLLDRELNKCRKKILLLEERLNKQCKTQESVPINNDNKTVEEESEFDKITISDCNFSNRTDYLLRRAGINTVGQMLRKYPGRKNLLSINQLGLSTLHTIINTLEAKGIDMGRYKK